MDIDLSMHRAYLFNLAITRRLSAIIMILIARAIALEDGVLMTHMFHTNPAVISVAIIPIRHKYRTHVCILVLCMN